MQSFVLFWLNASLDFYQSFPQTKMFDMASLCTQFSDIIKIISVFLFCLRMLKILWNYDSFLSGSQFWQNWLSFTQFQLSFDTFYFFLSSFYSVLDLIFQMSWNTFLMLSEMFRVIDPLEIRSASFKVMIFLTPFIQHFKVNFW